MIESNAEFILQTILRAQDILDGAAQALAVPRNTLNPFKFSYPDRSGEVFGEDRGLRQFCRRHIFGQPARRQSGLYDRPRRFNFLDRLNFFNGRAPEVSALGS